MELILLILTNYHFNMELLELFAGSRSIGKAAESLGGKVYSIDYKPFDQIDLVQDIEFLTPEMIPIKPTAIWASIPCTSYSIAAISHHRNKDGSPKSEFAKKSDALALNTLKLIEYYNVPFFIENPRGFLRKMWFMKNIPRATVWYCKYNDIRAKPTDIFTNQLKDLFNPNGWTPRPICFNGNRKCHHEKAPRGSATGTQGLKDNYERSKIPHELCIEIINFLNQKK